MKHNKIIPSLWFITDGGNISKVVKYYKNIFGNDFEEGDIVPHDGHFSEQLTLAL